MQRNVNIETVPDDEYTDDCYNEYVCSIAISLKRIADNMEAYINQKFITKVSYSIPPDIETLTANPIDDEIPF